jgi:hypothetical protein
MARNNNNSDIMRADTFISNRIAEPSKVQYERKVKHFELFVQRKHPELCEATRSSEDNQQPAVDFSRACTSENLKEFFGYISIKRNKRLISEDNPEGEIRPHKYQSYEHVSGYKSALKDALRSKRITIETEVDQTLTDFFDGYKRQIAELKQNGEMEITEGKQPLRFTGYRFLAKKAMLSTKDMNLSTFGHVFLLFCWNLMARCHSVSSLMYNHIEWEHDSMTVVFPTHKGIVIKQSELL